MAGYNWIAGKSNNAVWAEENGMVTKSKITAAWLRKNGIDEKLTTIKLLIKVEAIWPEEWHHTSRFFNQTDYYSAESIVERLAELEEFGHLAIWRDMAAICALRRADYFTLRQEFLRRLNGQDMFGNTEPTWQNKVTPHPGE